MGDKPVTTTFLVGGLLWALWHWRRRRLSGAGGAPGATKTEEGQAPPFDAGARLAGLAS